VRVAQGPLRRFRQIVPSSMEKLFDENPSPKSERAMRAMLQMKKLDMAALMRALSSEREIDRPGKRG
jgi:hypothetical protein